ncbi:Dbl homology domain-containing protein [Mycena maculata]|uniref:Dbl homology domain-containing protein n=1 Tax=Mycena maculata TaxID=230809 RepID=A0AAD7JG98_9AGAR|nr:Dbl homology domain-containing protein [Mycena maculata]
MSIHPLPVHDNTTDSRPSLSPLSEQCSALRARLMQIRGFPHYFSLLSPDNDRSIDSVTELWDLFSLGGSLCYLFDQLPEEGGFHKINNNSRFEEHYEVTPARAQVHAIALFCMQIRGLAVKQNIPDCECFTITDLYDHTSTEGFTKALTTVTAIVNHLPAYVFETSPPSLDTPDPNDRSPVTNNAQETRRNSIIYELVETERKYVQNLDMMQKYVTTLSQSNLIDRETIHLLFPNVDKLVDFQRKFLMGIDAIAELSWQDQRWGQHFIQAEEEFSVYHTYSANYDNASELLVADDLQEKLAEFNHILPVTELPVCMIRPVSRVYKYPLLIDALLNASSTTEYRHYEELKRGSEAIKRVTGQVDGARRRSANAQTVKSLPARISDWKGHNLETFGELLLYDVLMFTSSNITREFHVFLFEKVILCCREAPKASSTGRKFGKKSILKTQVYNPCISLGRPVDATPLLLKGRIFVRDVTQAILALPSSPSACSVPREYPLTVWWKRDNVPDFFTIRCRHEHRMQKWESEINQLISKSGGPLEDQTLDPEQSGVSQNSPLYDQLLRAGIHNLENFGELVLDDIFMVTSSNITLEFHVFLFEKAILCCGEGSSNGQKFGKRNARTTPLVLKGRIFLQDVVQAALTSPRSLNSGAFLPSFRDEFKANTASSFWNFSTALPHRLVDKG